MTNFFKKEKEPIERITVKFKIYFNNFPDYKEIISDIFIHKFDGFRIRGMVFNPRNYEIAQYLSKIFQYGYQFENTFISPNNIHKIVIQEKTKSILEEK